MGPMQRGSARGSADPRAEDNRTIGGKSPNRPFSPVRSSASPEARRNERLDRVLRQKRGLDAMVVGVLCVALFFGLVGLAIHFLWVVAIFVLALGLGYTVANSRRNRIDMVNQRAERGPDPIAPRR